jgi:hypothetical protein
VYIYRSSIKFDHIFVSSTLDNAASSMIMFRSVRLVDRKVSFHNCHTQNQGLFFFTRDPYNIETVNTTQDFYRSTGGYSLSIICNYPEASGDMSLKMSNVEMYYSRDRPTNVPFADSCIRYAGAGTFVLEDVHFNIYSDFVDFSLSLVMFATPV